MQRDPLALKPWPGSGFQDGMSLYGYARQRPSGFMDPFGRFGISCQRSACMAPDQSCAYGNYAYCDNAGFAQCGCNPAPPPAQPRTVPPTHKPVPRVQPSVLPATPEGGCKKNLYLYGHGAEDGTLTTIDGGTTLEAYVKKHCHRLCDGATLNMVSCWSARNPQQMKQVRKWCPKLTTWCGCTGEVFTYPGVPWFLPRCDPGSPHPSDTGWVCFDLPQPPA